MQDVTIRLADLNSEGDIAGIRALTGEYAHQSVLGRPLDAEVLDRLPEAMRNHGGVRVLLALVEAEIVGIATCVLSFSSFGAAQVLNIHDFAVTASWQGKGVGAQLLVAAEALAVELGCKKITLEVVPENPARRLYARAGFTEEAIFCGKRL